MKALRNKILVKVPTLQKEEYALTESTIIYLATGYDFNLRADRPALGYVIDGDNLPEGVKCLINYLAIEPSYIVENEDILTDKEKREGYKVYSIPVDMCFCIKLNDEWTPCKNFLLTERIFLPYNGKIVGVEPQRVKNRMYVVKGNDEWDGEITDISGKVVTSLDNCDYEIIWHDTDHRKYHLIRTMHREITGIDEGMTQDVKKGKYLVGISPTNCKTLN